MKTPYRCFHSCSYSPEITNFDGPHLFNGCVDWHKISAIWTFSTKSTKVMLVTLTSRRSFMPYWRHQVSPFLYIFFPSSVIIGVTTVSEKRPDWSPWNFSWIFVRTVRRSDRKIIDLDPWPWPTLTHSRSNIVLAVDNSTAKTAEPICLKFLMTEISYEHSRPVWDDLIEISLTLTVTLT